MMNDCDNCDNKKSAKKKKKVGPDMIVFSLF